MKPNHPLRKTIATIAALILPISVLSACGTEELQDQKTADYYPLAVGYSWDYFEETTTGDTDILRYEIVDTDMVTFDNGVGEKQVYLVNNTFPESTTTEWRLQYYFDDGVRVDRLQHEIYTDATTLFKTRQYDPGFLRFDRSKTEPGTTWNESITRYETKNGITTSEAAEYQFVVDSNTASLTLVDGTEITGCIQISRTNLSDGEKKIYTFGPNIGKVKEETVGGSDGEKIELLTAIPAWVEE